MKKLGILLISLISFISVVAKADTVSLYFENDSLGGGTDRYYTNGVRLQWLRDTYGFVVGQNIYTPDEIDVPYQCGQRPYAGYLYAGYILNWVAGTTEIDIGVVGPEAQGEEVQNYIHELIGSKQALWDKQVDEGFSPQLYHRYIFNYSLFKHNYWGATLNPYLAGSLGWVNIAFRAGGVVRIGYNLPPYQSMAPVIIVTGTPYKQPYTLYLLAAVEARAIAYNVFLEGTLDDGTKPGITTYPIVADIIGGIGMGYKAVEIQYKLIYRTKEYTTQNYEAVFGSIQINYKF